MSVVRCLACLCYEPVTIHNNRLIANPGRLLVGNFITAESRRRTASFPPTVQIRCPSTGAVCGAYGTLAVINFLEIILGEERLFVPPLVARGA